MYNLLHIPVASTVLVMEARARGFTHKIPVPELLIICNQYWNSIILGVVLDKKYASKKTKKRRKKGMNIFCIV